MMQEPHLTDEEAKRFLDLFETVDEAIEQALSEALNDDLDVEAFVERWEMPPSAVRKYNSRRDHRRRFVERVYGDDESE